MIRKKLTPPGIATLHLERREYSVYDTVEPGLSVRVRPSGAVSYQVRYRLKGEGRKGTARRWSIGGVKEIRLAEARKEARRIQSRAKLGEDPAGERTAKRKQMTVADLCDRYLEEGVATKRASTIATDRGRIERHIKPLLGRKRVGEVSQGNIDEFLRDVAKGKTRADIKTGPRGRAIVHGGKGTATRTVGLLGGIFSFAVRNSIRPDNPVRGVKRYRDKTGERFLSPAELGRLGATLRAFEVKGVNKTALAIIRLLAVTGARKSEITALRWSDVDLERACLRLGDSKTGPKTILLGSPALTIFAGLGGAKGSTYVFPAESGGSHFQGADKVWKKVREAAGLPDLRLHDLRHSFASIGLAAGDALPMIAKLLGHADVRTTSRYAHLADDPVRTANTRISGRIAAAMEARPAKNIAPFKSKKSARPRSQEQA